MNTRQSNESERTSPRWIRVSLVACGAAIALVVGGAMVLPLGEASAGLFGRSHRPGDHSPEEIREKVGFVTGWVLDSVDATDEQQAQVSVILDRTFVTLAPLHANRAAARAAFVGALTSPNVDRAALEELRVDKLAEMTVASEELLQAIADIAEVLTPTQRIELAEMAERFH